ncbi:uncharacterized protein [Acropora muricata]|uniref:uncharacterized protein n=1 Tax=Acropora muricata TaxID=159855 RepID=UPI0034E51BDC
MAGDFNSRKITILLDESKVEELTGWLAVNNGEIVRVYEPRKKNLTPDASSASYPQCHIMGELRDCPKNEETVDPNSIVPFNCSIKSGGTSNQNTTWKQVYDLETPKKCLVLKTGNSKTRIYLARELEIEVSSYYVEISENKGSSLSCGFTGRPRPPIVWDKDNNPIANKAVITVRETQCGDILFTTSTLPIPGRPEFRGFYTCSATSRLDSGWSSTKKDTIEVQFSCPTGKIEAKGSRHVETNAFENISISCFVHEQAEWGCDAFVWHFKDKTLKTDGKYRITKFEDIGDYCKTGFKLEIINATENDEGHYRCQQSKCLPETWDSSDIIEINVRPPPENEPCNSHSNCTELTAEKEDIQKHQTPKDVEEDLEKETFNGDVDIWEISRKRITLEEVIGSGSFGTVWRAVLSRGNGQPGIQFVAAKCFTPTSGEEGRKSIIKEIELGKELGESSPENVVKFIGCVTTQIHPILVMEYLPCGDLLGFLRKSRGIVDKYYRGEGEVPKLKTYDLVSFSNQIATGMVFLASRGIIHRDLAARNILLDRNCVCKLADFGLYYHNFKYGHGNAKKGCVPVKWTAPEVLYGDIAKLSSKSDVWSYGVVLYEIFTFGGIPYPGWSEARTIAELRQGYRMPQPPHIDKSLYHLMNTCWQEEPMLRPEFLHIRNTLREFIEKELYLGLMDQSKYDGSKYSKVEDVVVAVDSPLTKKWSSLKR